MDFFKKAAALALSVIGALFTSVEPPKADAQVQAKPVAVQIPAPTRVASLELQKVLLGREAEGRLTVIVLNTSSELPARDLASERFLSLIEVRPSVKHPLTTTPWYMSGQLFAAPAMDDASEFFRALVANDFEVR
ncbi:MAG: hypothetical protein WD716_00380 [Fimbriimonadaceae bacterium]